MIDRWEAYTFARRVIRVTRTRQLTLLAAGVAFYAFVSLVPLALLVLGIAASIGGERLAIYVGNAVNNVLTPSAQQLLADALVDETGRRSATIVGAFGLIWGSSRVLSGLDRAFAQIYGTVASKSLLETIWDATVVAGAITVGLTLVAFLELVLVVAPIPGIGVLAPILAFMGLVAAFLPLYVIFPGTDVGLREALPGTVFASVGWLVLSRTFAVYASVAGGYAFYGALGAVLLVLVWLYIGAIVVVFGAVVNAVGAERELDRQLQSTGSRQIEQRSMTDDATDRDDVPAEDASQSDDDRTGAAPAADEKQADSEDPVGRAETRDRTQDRADDAAALREEIERLRDELDSLEDGVNRRTVRRDDLERDLKKYVRRRVRRGHARGWGPYLVLLYGTAMTIGAFYLLSGGWAVLAMFVVWTSTLGVYLLMVLFGAATSALGFPGRLADRVSDWRS